MVQDASFSVLQPSTVEDALRLVQDRQGARLVAGGTALQLEWARGLAKPEVLINLGRIAGIAGISRHADHLHIGALTPLAALCKNAMVAERLPL